MTQAIEFTIRGAGQSSDHPPHHHTKIFFQHKRFSKPIRYFNQCKYQQPTPNAYPTPQSKILTLPLDTSPHSRS